MNKKKKMCRKKIVIPNIVLGNENKHNSDAK